jgi:hypothetical protein
MELGASSLPWYGTCTKHSLYDLSTYTPYKLFYHGRKLYTLNSDVISIVVAHVDLIFGQFELGVDFYEL